MTNPVIDFRVRADPAFQTKVTILKRRLGLTNSSLVKFAISKLWAEENVTLTTQEFEALVEKLDKSKSSLSSEKITQIAKEAIQDVRNGN